MTLDEARELITVQLGFGGSNNRNAIRLKVGGIQHDHEQEAVNLLIRELGLPDAFDLAEDTYFSYVAQ